MTLKLVDGTTIVDLMRPRQGMRHRVLFGVEERTGREVAVKIELIAGALEPERLALEWLTAQDGPAPRLVAAGRLTAAGENPGAACLVTERVAGEPPRLSPGWNRLGRALARLAALPWRGSDLTTLAHDAFLALHEERVADLSEAIGRDLAPELPATSPAYPDSPLVFTHGDPGPGNFLDDGAAGTLIDWEDALVAPRGLDLGRATFIALLGSGPEGYVAERQAARAAAVTAGFLAEAEARSPSATERRWWLSVAGVQFAHRRLERAGQPGVLPWQEAAHTLRSAVGSPQLDNPRVHHR